ncbi:MAG: aminotransferase class V-fold PLP-dependent enzyme [Victivallales bacterium]|nr:aminotransferase class V-fold PLP-dependent enzyme [Victivallales bacterium]
MRESEERLKELAKTFKTIVSANIPQAVFNGDSRKRLPGHVSVSFPNRDGEALLHLLDLKGICVSTGAACNSRSTEVSHVLWAIGLPVDAAKGTLRVTFGHGNTVHDAEIVANTMIELMKKIMSNE